MMSLSTREAFPTTPIRHLAGLPENRLGLKGQKQSATTGPMNGGTMAAAWTPPDDVLTRPAPLPDHEIRYGTGPENVADVRLPAVTSRPAPLVIFLHGGFWRAAYDRSHTGPMATALAAAGYAVCVPEFRRTGQAGGGWPGTFEDVAAAVDRSPALVRTAAGPGVVADEPALLAGHSAGGHLALWSAGRHLLGPDSGWHADTRARGVVVLAGVSGLADCYDQRLGNGAAADLMGGGPARFPQRYRVADPAGLLPLGCPVRLVHGSLDDVVPPAMSRGYAALGRAAGDDTAVAELPGASHLDVIDPLSPAWAQVLATFQGLAPVALSSP
jgi:acetyl esterase/lipase